MLRLRAHTARFTANPVPLPQFCSSTRFPSSEKKTASLLAARDCGDSGGDLQRQRSGDLLLSPRRKAAAAGNLSRSRRAGEGTESESQEEGILPNSYPRKGAICIYSDRDC
jgi:hypothetical protein